MRKNILLFPLLLLGLSACEETPVTPTQETNVCTDISSITFYSYKIGVGQPTVDQLCDNGENLTIEFQCDSIAILDNTTILPLINQNNDYSEYELVTGEPNVFGTTTNLKYFPCADSIMLKESDNYETAAFFTYGKVVNAAPCTTLPPVSFIETLCHQDSTNHLCYSSANQHFNHVYAGGFGLSYTIVDSINQEIFFSFSDAFTFTLPTDNSLQLLTGKYWINSITGIDYPIIDCMIDIYDNVTVSFNDFHTGNMEITQNGTDYIFTFELISCEKSRWTGYYKGPVIL